LVLSDAEHTKRILLGKLLDKLLDIFYWFAAGVYGNTLAAESSDIEGGVLYVEQGDHKGKGTNLTGSSLFT
jgi:hypothetical protein